MLLSVVLACRVFAISCQYICAIVVILFALSWVISVQQFTNFLRFRYSSGVIQGSVIGYFTPRDSIFWKIYSRRLEAPPVAWRPEAAVSPRRIVTPRVVVQPLLIPIASRVDDVFRDGSPVVAVRHLWSVRRPRTTTDVPVVDCV